MARSANAQLAVDMYNTLHAKYGWNPSRAWEGIARLLLTCEVWRDGQWVDFHNVVVYRESNEFPRDATARNAALERAERLSTYLALCLGVSPQQLCSEIGLFWRHAQVRSLQPHNLVGNAFRSLVVRVLEQFGSSDVMYEEEVNPHELFPGHTFHTRSSSPKVDIVAYRDGTPVALISTRWRYRHDRVDVVDEALAYMPAARRANPLCRFYAVTGEFSPARLKKILDNCPPMMPTGAISGAVHFAPHLISRGLGENGRVKDLHDLEWLIGETASWR